MNLSDKFSTRHAIEPEEAEIIIREDAPAELRSAFVQIAYEAGLSPTKLRQLVCRVLRTEPDSNNWAEIPNVDEEVKRSIGECKWYEVYDAIEAVDQALRAPEKHGLKGSFRSDVFERELNNYFRKAGIGWHLEDGQVQARGPETFNRPVADSISRLADTGFNTAKTELHEALSDMSRRPDPDLTGALQHAIAALECVAREEEGSMPDVVAGVHSDPDILGGTPVFCGTRVPFGNLIDDLERGYSLDEFLDAFPSVSRQDAVAALEAAHETISGRARSAR